MEWWYTGFGRVWDSNVKVAKHMQFKISLQFQWNRYFFPFLNTKINYDANNIV